MAFPITVPRLGWEMEEAVFVEWLKKEGEPVNEGEPLFVLESDKAVQEVEAIDSGILRISPSGPSQGDTVPVGAILGYLVEPGEEVPSEPQGAATPGAHGDSPLPAAPSPIRSAASVEPPHPTPASTPGAPTISPRAARLAAELGVDWARLRGSGKSGRISERDIRVAASQQGADAAAPPETMTPGAPGRVLPVGPVRRRIADRMATSAHTTAPVTLTTTADATDLVSLRARLKAAFAARSEVVPSYVDMIAKLTASVLRDHPMLNARWGGDEIVLPDGIHIGIAADTEGGLLVPVVRDAASLSLGQFAARSRDLVERARSRRLLPEEMQGGTFTITNLGSYGVEGFTPIINLPECAILGLGRIRREPVAIGDRIEIRDMMVLSLTFDHRVVDGGPAARFLDAVRQGIERPDLLEREGTSTGPADDQPTLASRRQAISASTQSCEAVIIGAGPGGYVAALRIAAMGGKATLVERGCVGGVCLNTGCIPTKALLRISKLYHELASAGSLGIEVGQVRLDFAKAIAHKDKVVAGLTKGLGTLLKGRGVEIIAGRGRLIDAQTVGVDSPDGVLRIAAPSVILSTGTVPAPLPGIDIDGKQIMNTDQALAMRELPESVLIIGGGPNGVEFATMLSEFGSRVTLVEAMDRILPTTDADAAKEVVKSLKKRRVTVHCGTKVDGIERRDDGVLSRLSSGQTVETVVVIVAIGRRTQIDDLGLDEAGVKHDGRCIHIDEKCATTTPSVYAIGDITGKGPYAHVAYRQATVAASNVMGVTMTEDYRVVPTVVFSHPEVAQVGLTEDAAHAAGTEVEVGRFRYQASGAAQAFGEPNGFCKLVAEGGTHRVLGATIVGLHAAEVIHEVAVAIKHGMTAHDIADTIHAHPSLAEPIAEATDALLGMPLHSL